MRVIEHSVAEAKGAIRRVLSRAGRVDPAHVVPARVVFRVDEADLPEALTRGHELGLHHLTNALVDAVDWLGPVPVTVLAGNGVDRPIVAGLIRFAHRLECPTEVVSNGTGLDFGRAVELIDSGLDRARVLVGGVSADVHASAVGNTLLEATTAVRALVDARQDRGAVLDIEVAIPWAGRANAEVRAVIGWARQVGADGYRVLAPLRAREMPADPELLAEVGASNDAFNRTAPRSVAEIEAMAAAPDGGPGAPRASAGTRGAVRRLPCPVGGQRLEITGRGHVLCCPFKAPIGLLRGDLSEVWSRAGAHLEAIKACDRACPHVELAPARVFAH